jgi:predicted ribosome quality control (RQC) complex YloA/Tae2 family protein
MSLRWDPLLVRELAHELDGRLKGAQLRALRMDGSRRELALLLRDATLLWGLHPGRGFVRFFPPAERSSADLPLAAKVRAVRAPPDERLLVTELIPSRRDGPMDLVIELLGNQWNAIVVDARSRRVRHVLVRRGEPRPLRVGGLYDPPPSSPRRGTTTPLTAGEWTALLEAVTPDDRPRKLVASVAWTSSLNAQALLDDGGSGYPLWASMAHGGLPTAPVLLASSSGLQPYPWPLPGSPAESTSTLIEAFERSAEAESGRVPAALPAPELLGSLERALDDARRRWTSLCAELDGAGEPRRLSALGDLILARIRAIPPGLAKVRLEGFHGETLDIVLDPSKSPQENAADFYADAAKARRARKRLPALIDLARRDVEELESLLEQALKGEATSDELRAALPERPDRRGIPEGEALPYRTFRSSGGLEIRVGRGARHNDDLTFHHSSPQDVWLHARHAAGAHVVLRWPGPGNPPGRDLEEAAVLAALHSKARTSGRVPVDWTRRKYVRKPRHAPAGTVRMERARTLFVEPDPDLLERLASPG